MTILYAYLLGIPIMFFLTYWVIAKYAKQKDDIDKDDAVELSMGMSVAYPIFIPLLVAGYPIVYLMRRVWGSYHSNVPPRGEGGRL